MYKAVFFPDPYHVRIRETITWNQDNEFFELVKTYLMNHPGTGYIMYGPDGKELERIYYYYINHKLGRV